ncbi:Wzt carbohydrate-binding domain-containing protein [Lactovum odontotermitis]
MENEVVNAEAMENEIVDVRVRKLSDLTLEDFFVSQNGKKTRIVNFKESFKIDISFNSPKALQNLNMGVHLINQSGQDLMALSTKSLSRYDIHAGLNNIVFTVENIFTEGTYYFNFALEEKESKKLLIQEAELYQFSIFGLDEEKYSKYGLTYPKAEIEIIN